MTAPCDPIGEIDLLAYVDDLLDPRRRAEVEAQLAADPDAAARVEDFRAQREAIRRLYDPVLDEAVPDRLSAVLDRPPRHLSPTLVRLAAMIVLTLLAGYAGWWLRGQETPTVQALTADTGMVRQASSWGEAAVDGTTPGIVPPDLSRYGYTLVGRSRSGGTDHPAIRFDYQGESGPLSLFLSSAAPGPTAPTPFAGAEEAGLYWVDGTRIYAVTGPDQHLAPLAEAIRRQTSGSQPALGTNGASADPATAPARTLELLPVVEPDTGVGQL